MCLTKAREGERETFLFGLGARLMHKQMRPINAYARRTQCTNQAYIYDRLDTKKKYFHFFLSRFREIKFSKVQFAASIFCMRKRWDKKNAGRFENGTHGACWKTDTLKMPHLPSKQCSDALSKYAVFVVLTDFIVQCESLGSNSCPFRINTESEFTGKLLQPTFTPFYYLRKMAI